MLSRGQPRNGLFCGNDPVDHIDPLGLDIAVGVSGYSGGYNPFGHVGSGVTDSGTYSFGTSESNGSNFTNYVSDRSGYGNTTYYIIPATPAQDAAYIKGFLEKQHQGYKETSNTCASAVANGLKAAGIINDPTILPAVLQRDLENLVSSGKATVAPVPYKATYIPPFFSSFNPVAGPPAPASSK